MTRYSSAPHRRIDTETWTNASGVDFLRSMSTDERWDAPHVRLLGYRIVEVEHGEVTLSWEVPEALLNPAGIAHGGFLVALLDDAAGLACASRYPRFVPQLTVELHTDFVGPVPAGPVYRVEGEVVRPGRGTNLADARLVTDDGRLLARTSGIFQPNRRAIPSEHWAAAGLG